MSWSMSVSTKYPVLWTRFIGLFIKKILQLRYEVYQIYPSGLFLRARNASIIQDPSPLHYHEYVPYINALLSAILALSWKHKLSLLAQELRATFPCSIS